MAHVNVSADLPADAARAWAFLRRLDNSAMLEGIMDRVEITEADGVIERVITIGERSIRQRIESIDDDARQIAIRTIESNHPLAQMQATMTITPVSDATCELTWAAEIATADDEPMLAALVRDFYLVMIERFKAALEA